MILLTNNGQGPEATVTSSRLVCKNGLVQPLLQVRKNFNDELGHLVWTVERIDGTALFPKAGIHSLNYHSPEVADIGKDRIERELASGQSAI